MAVRAVAASPIHATQSRPPSLHGKGHPTQGCTNTPQPHPLCAQLCWPQRPQWTGLGTDLWGDGCQTASDVTQNSENPPWATWEEQVGQQNEGGGEEKWRLPQQGPGRGRLSLQD